jgi:hypothetical protein
MWSQRLDISYYSKGPLVAWLIRASSEVFGSVSRSICGTDVLAVRLPAVFCGSAILVGLYVLSLRVYHSERFSCLVVVGALTLPMVAVSRTIMTIDSPFICCWCWALVLGHEAIVRRTRWAWPALGIVLALGILAKYTMILWLGSACLFLVLTPSQRPLLRTAGPWIAVVIAALGYVPILWWNISHDWQSFRHVSTLAGATADHASSTIRWIGPLEFVGSQAALLVGFWFVVWLAAMIANRPWKETDPSKQFLWWLSVPTFVTFLVFSVRTSILLNWSVPAYVSGMILAAGWFRDRLIMGTRRSRAYLGTCAALTAIVSTFATICIFHVEIIRPALTSIAGSPTESSPMPLRRFDPTCRLRGWRHLGKEVAMLEKELQSEGSMPLIAGSRWFYASEVSFYGAGHPNVYSLGLLIADRHSQFDVWRPNPLSDPEHFVGRTFIFVDVGLPNSTIEKAFDRIEPARVVEYMEGGQPIAKWYLTVCRGFRGAQVGSNTRY